MIASNWASSQCCREVASFKGYAADVDNVRTHHRSAKPRGQTLDVMFWSKQEQATKKK